MNCQDVQEENPLLHCSFEGGRHVGPPKGRTGDAIVEATTQKGLQDVRPSPAYEILRTRLALGQCPQPQQIPDEMRRMSGTESLSYPPIDHFL